MSDCDPQHRRPWVYPEDATYTVLWIGIVAGFAFLALAFAGCSSLPADYVDADRRTHATIAPMVSGCLAAHPHGLDEAEAAQRRRLLRSWAARIAAGEEALR